MTKSVFALMRFVALPVGIVGLIGLLQANPPTVTTPGYGGSGAVSSQSYDLWVEADPRDVMAGTLWSFHDSKNRKINEFRFTGKGNVHCKSNYREAKWRRLDENSILFSYGLKSYIVFHFQTPAQNAMKGFHSGSGPVRYLKKMEL